MFRNTTVMFVKVSEVRNKEQIIDLSLFFRVTESKSGTMITPEIRTRCFDRT